MTKVRQQARNRVLEKFSGENLEDKEFDKYMEGGEQCKGNMKLNNRTSRSKIYG